MNANTDEHISALMDGELAGSDAHPLITQLQRDTALRGTWGRYHLIRAALRDHLPATLELNVAHKVMAALAAEPTVLAPRGVMLQVRLKRLAPVLKQVSGLAVAATVTAVAILGVQTNGPDVMPTAQIATLNSAPALPAAAPFGADYPQSVASSTPPFSEDNMLVATPITPMQPVDRHANSSARWDRSEPALESKLNHYLTNHSEYAVPTDVHGMLPYGRIVGYDPAAE